MGSLTLNRPSVQGRTADEKIENLRRSINTMVDELNLADWSAYRTLRDIGTAIDAGELQGRADETSEQLKGYAALRALVVKTADYAVTHSETFRLQLRSDYVAVSDFGKYWQNATMTVNGTSFGIEQLFEYSEGVNNKYTVNSRQYVKTGLLYYNGVTPVYGVGVGNLATTVSGGNTVIDKTQGELVTVTPDRIGFWQTGSEIAYITSKKIYFPSSTLVAYDAQLSGTITAAAGSVIGPWHIEDGCIWRGSSEPGNASGMYFGTAGLYVSDYFSVDSGGFAKMTQATMTNATVSGNITAKTLNVENCEVTGNFKANVLYGGTLNFAHITCSGLYADDIESGTLNAGTITFGYGNSGFDCPSQIKARMYYGNSTEVRVSDDGCAMTTAGGELWAGTSSAGVTGLTWQGSSDRALKKDIVYGPEYEKFFDDLRLAEFRFRRNPETVHYGFIAQDVQRALRKSGLSDRIVGKLKHLPENGRDRKKYDLALAYDEFIPLCVDQLQKMRRRMDSMKKQVDELERRENEWRKM